MSRSTGADKHEDVREDGGPDAVDGRTARRDRNREAVLDAVLELFTEGMLDPGVDEIANRSGLSPRSVYRYSADPKELMRAALARHLEKIAPLFEMPDPGVGPLDERVTRFVVNRMRLYEFAAPTARASLLRASQSTVIRAQLDLQRRRLRTQVEDMFAPELSAMRPAPRRAALAAADTLFQFEGAEHLRVHLGFTEAQASDILVRSLTALLAPPP